MGKSDQPMLSITNGWWSPWVDTLWKPVGFMVFTTQILTWCDQPKRVCHDPEKVCQDPNIMSAMTKTGPWWPHNRCAMTPKQVRDEPTMRHAIRRSKKVETDLSHAKVSKIWIPERPCCHHNFSWDANVYTLFHSHSIPSQIWYTEEDDWD